MTSMTQRQPPQGEEDAASMEGVRRRQDEALGLIVARLAKLADEQVSKKQQVVEDRWYADLRQYHGRYDPDTEAKLRTGNKSQLFVNYTRQKTSGWEARLSDMLFPTDDRNWGIRPTPVPELARDAQAAAETAAAKVEQANQQQAAGDAQGAAATAAEADVAAQVAAKTRAVMDEARRRAEAMELEIDDQLTEARYNQKCRDVIHDACKLGTGVIKGPVTAAKPRRRWEQQPDMAGGMGGMMAEAGGMGEMAPAGGEWAMQSIDDPRPDVHRVDPWNYFPDMSARTVADAEFHFERHLLSKKDMRKLAQRPGFRKDAIRELLRDSPRQSLPSYVGVLKDITGVGQSLAEERFHVWEYHGPLEHDDLVEMCSCLGDEDMRAEVEDSDPLLEKLVTVWFCQDRLLFFGPHPLDSEDSLYSVFTLEKDDSSIFGFGVPYLMRDSQKAINAAWRAMLDNAALSTGPQIVVNRGAIEPASGGWDLEPRKVWLLKDKTAPLGNLFGVFPIDSRQNELAGVIELAKAFADDETNLPLVAQGESGSHQTTTAQGMSMLMNSVNVVFRRVIKNFDDDLTTPVIRRFYDWNMQFAHKPEIKGDYAVDARGSSVLLVREVQAQNLMAMVTNWSAHPVLGSLIKVADAARKTVQAHMLAAGEIIKSDEEIEQEQQAQAAAQQQGAQPDPAAARAEAQLQAAKIDAQTRLQIKQMEHDIAMMRLAADQNMTLQQVQAQLADRAADRDSKERLFAAEAALKRQQGSGI